MLKMKGTETLQRVTALAMEALGHYATPDQRQALGIGANAPAIGPDYAAVPTARYLNMRASTIYGGMDLATAGVSVRPGATTLTVMPSLPTRELSCARNRARRSWRRRSGSAPRRPRTSNPNQC